MAPPARFYHMSLNEARILSKALVIPKAAGPTQILAQDAIKDWLLEQGMSHLSVIPDEAHVCVGGQAAVGPNPDFLLTWAHRQHDLLETFLRDNNILSSNSL